MTKRSLAWLMFAAAVGGCAPTAERFGAPLGPWPGEARSFAMAQDGPAPAAVRKALIDAGLQESAEGALRVEVGFAVRPRGLAVSSLDEAGKAEVVSPAGKAPPGLCRRQAYVLTIALVERQSGKIKGRGGATLSRCEGSPAEVLPLLTQTALQGLS